MGRFLEHTAANVTTEDPAIFQLLAERAGGKAGGDLGVVTFMHHRFADYVSTMGNWIQDEWTRSAERYEELPFGESTESGRASWRERVGKLVCNWGVAVS